MSDIVVTFKTQKIVLNPAGNSIGVVNAGPVGPTGVTGPSEAAAVLTIDGQLLTRAGGVLAPITRANLSADSAFSSAYAPLNQSVAPLTTTQRNALSGGALYRGRTIFNTDTGSIEVYYGSTTGWCPPWNTAWGKIYHATRASAVTGTASETLIQQSSSLSTLINRSYRISYRSSINITNSPNPVSVLTRVGGTSIDTIYIYVASVNRKMYYIATIYNPTSSASRTFDVAFPAGLTTVTDNDQALATVAALLIEDIGPNGNAPAS